MRRHAVLTASLLAAPFRRLVPSKACIAPALCIVVSAFAWSSAPVLATDWRQPGSQRCAVEGNCGEGKGVEHEYTEPEAHEPSQAELAQQNAASRYRDLVHSLLDNSNLLNRAWLDLPVGTEAEFLDTANQLHALLLNQADAIRFRVAKLQEKLEHWKQIADTYPERLATQRGEIETIRLERDRLAAALKDEEQQLELTKRTSDQLEARASHYEEDAKRNKDAVLDWFAVLLPPGMAKAASPQAYGAALDWVPSVPERQPDPPAIEASSPAQPAPLNISHVGVVNVDSSPAPLTGTAQNAVAQLEADAGEFRAAMAGNSWDLPNKVDALEPVAAALVQESNEVTAEKDGLTSEVQTSAYQLKQTSWALLLAQDNLKAAQETFLYRAAEAWIWENAKTEAVQQLKDETRRLVAAKWIGVPYRDLTDEEMHAFVSAGKGNIFGIGDKVLSSGDGLYEVVTRINTLQAHGQDYMQEAVRLASLGSPQQIMDFVGGMYRDLGDDSEELAKSNLGAMEIPEPWKSIAAKHFIKETSE